MSCQEQGTHAYPAGSPACLCGKIRRWRRDRGCGEKVCASVSKTEGPGSIPGTPANLTVFVCGPRRDHKCDSAGPFLYGGDGVPTLTSRPPAGVRGYTWGSVSCSVCGGAGIDDAVWTDF